MADSREKYSPDFREQAVRMLEEGKKSGHQIETEIGIGTRQVYRWRKALEAERQEGVNAFPGTGRARDEELAELRKEVRELREGREILRKALEPSSRITGNKDPVH